MSRQPRVKRPWARVSRRRALIEVLWRDHARLGLIVLNATAGVSTARNSAVAYAGLADTSLRVPLPATAWGKVLAEIQPDGAVSEQTALQAFALSYGPLPGVKVPSGPRGTIESGDLAVHWVLPLLPHLSPRLRTAIDRDLGFSRPDGQAHAAGQPNFGNPNFHPSEMLTADANAWSVLEGNASHLDYTLGLTIVAGTSKWLDNGAEQDSAPVNATLQTARIVASGC